MSSTTAILLIAHGSRQAAANADLFWLAAELARGGEHLIVVPSFLELAEPAIAEGGRRCVAAGARRVILVPYFLSAGVHVERDLKAQRAALAAEYPGIAFHLAAPLGRHPLLATIVEDRIRGIDSGPP